TKVHSCGLSPILEGEINIRHPKGIILGNNIKIGKNVFLDGRGGVIIGDNTFIGRGVVLQTGLDNYTESFDKYIANEIIIGNNVNIGINTVILPGVHIGNNIDIPAGSIVSEDLDDEKDINISKYAV